MVSMAFWKAAETERVSEETRVPVAMLSMKRMSSTTFRIASSSAKLTAKWGTKTAPSSSAVRI